MTNDNNRYLIILVIVIAFGLGILFYYLNTPGYEHYNDQTGRYCITCSDKNINQCLGCFNCGWCVDPWGNAGCIGGDVRGPYNNERCKYWYYGDPYARMLENNKNYKCEYGPMAANRVIAS